MESTKVKRLFRLELTFTELEAWEKSRSALASALGADFVNIYESFMEDVGYTTFEIIERRELLQKIYQQLKQNLPDLKEPSEIRPTEYIGFSALHYDINPDQLRGWQADTQPTAIAFEVAPKPKRRFPQFRSSILRIKN